MIKLKNKNYYINESIVVDVFPRQDQFYLKDNVGNVFEIDEYDYYTLRKRLGKE